MISRISTCFGLALTLRQRRRHAAARLHHVEVVARLLHGTLM